MHRILILFLLFNGSCANEVWPEVVADVARRYFDAPVILFLDFFHRKHNDHDGILLTRDSYSISSTLQKLYRNWSLFISDEAYERPAEADDIYFRIGLVRIPQIIIVIDEQTVMNEQELTKVVRKWRSNLVWFGRAKILIVVETSDGPDLARVVFQELWKQVKATTVALLESKGEITNFYSWHPYNPTCIIDITQVGFWQNSSNNNYTLFPVNNFKNLNKCEILTVGATLIPYVFPPDENGTYFEGTEPRIYKAVADYLNFTYRYVPVPPGEDPWTLIRNGTVSGMFGVLHREEAEVALSGARLNEVRLRYADALDPHYSDDVSFIGPKAPRTPKWKGVFLVFRRRIWYTVAATFITSTLIVYGLLVKSINLSKTNHGNNSLGSPPEGSASLVLIVMLAAQLGNSASHSKMPSGIQFKTFLSVFFFYTVTINAMYTSGLYGVLSQGLRTSEVDSYIEAAKNGWTVYTYASNAPGIKQTLPEYYNFITSKNLVVWTSDFEPCIKRAITHGDCYLLVCSLCAQYPINADYTTRSGRTYMRHFANRYKVHQPAIFMTRHHPLIPQFKRVIGLLVQSGWINHQIDDLLTQSFRIRSGRGLISVKEDDSRELSIEKELGAFACLFVLLTFSTLVFFFELLVHKFRNHEIRLRKRTLVVPHRVTTIIMNIKRMTQPQTNASV